MEFTITENNNHKVFKSDAYHYTFDKHSGRFARWGETYNDNPDFSPFGPELLDIEISAGGDCLGNCAFCYKSNGGNTSTHNMTLSEFEQILNKIPPTLTQIAFGIMNISTNPDFFAMMELCRERGIVPNYTCHGLDVTSEIAEKTASLCGAVAVSVVNKEQTYNAIYQFTQAGMKQVNIHFMLAKETLNTAYELIRDIIADPRLHNLNALVFLQCKNKGRAKDSFTPINSIKEYKKLITYCSLNGIRYGFDSCSTPLFLNSIINHPYQSILSIMAEPCESGLFSGYINCHGEFFPCSFVEGEKYWETGINIFTENFENIWFNERIVEWRQVLLNSTTNCDCIFNADCRKCPTFNIGCSGE